MIHPRLVRLLAFVTTLALAPTLGPALDAEAAPGQPGAEAAQDTTPVAGELPPSRPPELADRASAGYAPDLFMADPCKRHDFGYRNYGKGLRLQRDEDTRKWIDDILRQDMLDQCVKPEFIAAYPNCLAQAELYYGLVRANRGENWNEG